MVRNDPSLQIETIETSIDDSDIPIAIRKGTRECTNRPLYPICHYMSLKNLSPIYKKFIVSLNNISIPKIVFEALLPKEWRNAMREEIDALGKNKTWEVVDMPKEKHSLL